MRPRLLSILLFLLAGAIVNVVVALACATLNGPSYQRGTSETTPSDRVWWATDAPDVFPRTVQPGHMRSSQPGVDDAIIFQIMPGAGDDLITYSALRCRAGWPSRSLEGVAWEMAKGGIRNRLIIRGMIDLPERLPSRRDQVPIRPLWRGFAVNTLFYAVLLWLPLCGPFALRRTIRRRRGRCVKCGYDLRGNLAAGCPECGWKRAESKG